MCIPSILFQSITFALAIGTIGRRGSPKSFLLQTQHDAINADPTSIVCCDRLCCSTCNRSTSPPQSGREIFLLCEMIIPVTNRKLYHKVKRMNTCRCIKRMQHVKSRGRCYYVNHSYNPSLCSFWWFSFFFVNNIIIVCGTGWIIYAKKKSSNQICRWPSNISFSSHGVFGVGSPCCTTSFILVFTVNPVKKGDVSFLLNISPYYSQLYIAHKNTKCKNTFIAQKKPILFLRSVAKHKLINSPIKALH